MICCVVWVFVNDTIIAYQLCRFFKVQKRNVISVSLQTEQCHVAEENSKAWSFNFDYSKIGRMVLLSCTITETHVPNFVLGTCVVCNECIGRIKACCAV